jgi:hypothetical protein
VCISQAGSAKGIRFRHQAAHFLADAPQVDGQVVVLPPMAIVPNEWQWHCSSPYVEHTIVNITGQERNTAPPHLQPLSPPSVSRKNAMISA